MAPAEQPATAAKVTYRVRVNRRGVHLVKFTDYPANGKGVHIRSLVRWGR